MGTSVRTGIMTRLPGGKRRKSGTSVRPATTAFPSIITGSLLSHFSSASMSSTSSRVMSRSSAGSSARSNTGSPSGCALPAAHKLHATRNSTNPCPSLTACDMHTPSALPPFRSCVTLAVNTGAPPSMTSIHGS